MFGEGQIQPPENKVVSGLTEEKIKQICTDAYAFMKAQPIEETPFGDAEYDPRFPMMTGLEEIDEKVGMRFDAHGISKGSMAEQVEALNQLLTKGIDLSRTFHSMPLKGAEDAATAFGATGPHVGSFIVLSERDGSLKNGIKHVIVNEPFQGSLPLLTEAFPKVEFVPIASAAQTLSEKIPK